MKARNLSYENKFRKYLFSFDLERHKEICRNINVERKKGEDKTENNLSDCLIWVSDCLKEEGIIISWRVLDKYFNDFLEDNNLKIEIKKQEGRLKNE